MNLINKQRIIVDGNRIREYWSNEIRALIQTYKQFEILIPSTSKQGSAHNGEDGRYVEDFISEYLRKFLPKHLEVLTGFILRPAIKTGESGKERKAEIDTHSTQLDIIVYDSINYPIFQRFGNSVIVPPEGVVSIISVKKHLNKKDIKNECKALWNAAKLCKTIKSNDRSDKVRGPYLAIVSVHSNIEFKTKDKLDWIFEQMQSAYENYEKPTFDELIGFIGALDEWSIFKKRPTKKEDATYLSFYHNINEEHLGLQYILTGILSVFYDKTRKNIRRPGFTSFPSNIKATKLGVIEYNNLR
jgi:hypothetical protein